ncbi:MAG: peptidoglycan D,D-transpeptidase FtsI family protein [Thermoanaerobaculales bacterium]
MNRRRLLVVIVVLVLGGVIVAGRCLEIGLFQHDEWARRARRQHETVIEVPGLRGTIRTADGYILATSVSRVAIQVDTDLLTYPELFVRVASPLLGLAEMECDRRLNGGARTVWLAKRVVRDVGEQVRSLAPRAVVLVPDFARVYPLGALAAPVVGFVGREELLTVGRAGFEHHFDAFLAGEPEQYLAVNDAIQRKVRLERLHRGRAGYDLELTLIARLQARCEAALTDAMAVHGARAASAVVVEVQSGRILALASLPSFDPSDPGSAPPSNWRLRPVQDAFEPGSTIKPLVAAAALSAGVVDRRERFDCRRRGVRVAGRWIRDHVDPGMYNLDEVITLSANAGIIAVAERVPPEILWRALDGFGFGRRTGVGFPGEARGLLAETGSWSKMSRAGLALGQELTVSPLQLAMAYVAIANQGWLPRPRLVVPSGEGGRQRPGSASPPIRVMDEELARQVCAMLEDVVREGTGQLARVPGYRAAGKTGTAQRAVDGRFDDLHHVAWFAGFLPMPNPRFVVVVAIEDPAVEDFWASTVAAPVFSEIAQAAVCLLDLPPIARTHSVGSTGGDA